MHSRAPRGADLLQLICEQRMPSSQPLCRVLTVTVYLRRELLDLLECPLFCWKFGEPLQLLETAEQVEQLLHGASSVRRVWERIMEFMRQHRTPRS